MKFFNLEIKTIKRVKKTKHTIKSLELRLTKTEAMLKSMILVLDALTKK